MQGKVEVELQKIADDVLSIIDNKLFPQATDTDEKIFYQKMKGDYCRYIAEFAQGEKHQQVSEIALAAYEEATKIANADLNNAHPLRLGLALNFSVFYFEVMNDPEKACQMAKSAYDEGLAEAESLTEDQYQESSNILQLLRDNLIMWSADQEDA